MLIFKFCSLFLGVCVLGPFCLCQTVTVVALVSKMQVIATFAGATLFFKIHPHFKNLSVGGISCRQIDNKVTYSMFAVIHNIPDC